MANGTNVPAFTLGLRGKFVPDTLRCTGPIYAVAGQTQFDLSAEQQSNAGFIDSALTAYVDNGGNAVSAFLQFPSGQEINIPANTQGYFPILCPNPPRFTWFTNGGAGTAYVMFINAFVPANTWAATAL